MIPDEDFITDPKIPGPTKEEIRCLVICKSNVSSRDFVVDIGCGAGGLTLEFAKRARKVYAVDKNLDAINLTKKNLARHHLGDRVELILGDALEVLGRLPRFNILIIGGSSGYLPLIIKEGFKRLTKHGRILVTSILLETRMEALETMRELGMKFEVVEISVSKGKIMGRGTMMLARNPVTLVYGSK